MSARGRVGFVRWPAEAFYWAVLDTSVLPPKRWWQGRRRESRNYLFEPFLPCQLDEVQTAYLPLGAGTTLACAAERTRLQEAIGPETVALAPQALPSFVREGPDPARLNLATHDLTPPLVRRSERRAILFGAAVWVGLMLLVAIGFERRSRAANAASEEMSRAATGLYRASIGPMAAASRLPLSLQLESELRSLQRTRAQDAPKGPRADAAEALSKLLGAWPREATLWTDSVGVTASTMRIQARAPTSEGAQELAAALGGLEGWDVEQPSLQVFRDDVRATIQLRRSEDQ